ncbi:MAG: hypothetical protein ACREBC_26300 [Pyrinomonadaceae bacterium]
MHHASLDQAFAHLFEWCRKRDFAGYDPFDALNSKLFQVTFLKHSRSARLAWTQLFKRSPINLRSPALVSAERNSKGVALFALSALANFRRLRTKESEAEARKLIDDLLSMRLDGWSGAAWGYNFDWQSRVLFAPRGTPTLVPTAFAARALIEAFSAFEDDAYLQAARSTCDFIIEDLPRSVENETEICFSYTPDSNTRVYNASLLAAETLSSVGGLMREEALSKLAWRATRYVVARQNEDGSWPYGADANQAWVDNFHTAFLLSSLARIFKSCDTADAREFSVSLRRGYEFWRTSFFLADGWPKYYHDTLYPADAHAAASAIITLSDLRDLDPRALAFAERIAFWCVENLRDPRGFFYYQRRRFFTVRTPFMRWSQAWMLYALARLLEETRNSTQSHLR